MRILMVAAENDALPGGKVGGVGDVIRDIPVALADLDQWVDVITPCYGNFSTLPDAELLGELSVDFAGAKHPISLWQVPSRRKFHDKVRNLVVHSPLFSQPKPGVIYSNDTEAPFSTDANRFALFGAAVLSVIKAGLLPRPDVFHLHDWHSAFVLVLKTWHPDYVEFQSVHTVFSIHNLALQGIRPLRWDSSSLETWFPNLSYDTREIGDPRYTDCFNPMRAGIRLADRVHTVSPSYAQEILLPSNSATGFIGGEGLEADLRGANDAGRLVGVINGTDYDVEVPRKPTRKKLWTSAQQELLSWIGRKPEVRSVDFIAWQRLQAWLAEMDDSTMLLTSIGRLTQQKVSLLMQPWEGDGLVIDALLQRLGNGARLLLIGSGDSALEAEFTRVAARHENLLFLNGYAELLADQVYSAGDLFLMPSSFEPCGISQMLAMRAGQPCLVHAVGGLKDTIEDGVTGYQFGGSTPQEQAGALLALVAKLVRSHKRSHRKWQLMRKRASTVRFEWRDSAAQYLAQLYV